MVRAYRACHEIREVRERVRKPGEIRVRWSEEERRWGEISRDWTGRERRKESEKGKKDGRCRCREGERGGSLKERRRGRATRRFVCTWCVTQCRREGKDDERDRERERGVGGTKQ